MNALGCCACSARKDASACCAATTALFAVMFTSRVKASKGSERGSEGVGGLVSAAAVMPLVDNDVRWSVEMSMGGG